MNPPPIKNISASHGERMVFLNGRFVPEAEATISIFDRGFLYGDGLFETMRVVKSVPFRWADHLDRLTRGAEFLKISLSSSADELFKQATQLIALNALPDCLLRVTVSRGIGQRGYSPRGADKPTLLMTLHPVADQTLPSVCRAITSSLRLPANDPLAYYKTSNKLPQILARAEADAIGADEALLLNTNGDIVESSSGNLFWIEKGAIHTPPLHSGILPGVTRMVILEICRTLKIPAQEANIAPANLVWVEGVFLSQSSRGVVELASLDGHELARSPLTKKIQDAYDASSHNLA